MGALFYKCMSSIVRSLDPKLDRFRPPKRSVPYVAKSRRDLGLLLKRTPEAILNEREKYIMLALLSLSEKTARDLMLPKNKMSFLRDSDELSLFTLDRLFKSGAKCFPVLNKEGQVVGLIHAKDFDISKISENDNLAPYLDKNLFYVRADYSIEQLLSTFLRSNCGYALVIDEKMHILGSVTLERLFSMIFGIQPDDFCADDDPWSVANRQI